MHDCKLLLVTTFIYYYITFKLICQVAIWFCCSPVLTTWRLTLSAWGEIRTHDGTLVNRNLNVCCLRLLYYYTTFKSKIQYLLKTFFIFYPTLFQMLFSIHWLVRCRLYLVACTRIELVTLPWKGNVLTNWPTRHNYKHPLQESNSQCRSRNPMLYPFN